MGRCDLVVFLVLFFQNCGSSSFNTKNSVTSQSEYLDSSSDSNSNLPVASAEWHAHRGHKIEIYQKSSTGPNTRDGIIRIWVDDVEHTNYANLNLAPAGFTDTQINNTWDGGSWYDCPNRDCKRAWHHYWDHFYVSDR